MSALKNDLAVVTKTLKQLSRKTESLAKKVDKLEKAKAAKKPKAKKTVKAKAKRKVVARKRVAPKKRVAAKKRKAPRRKTPKRKVPKRKVAARRAPKKSASEVILSIMKASRSKKGVATAVLQKKTGFNNQKIRDNIYKLTKRGKIKRVGRGVYIVK